MRQLTGPNTYEVIPFLKEDAVQNDRYTVYLEGRRAVPGGMYNAIMEKPKTVW